MSNKLALIDIDSMFYQSSGKETLEECMITFREKLQNCLDKTECTHWIGFTSKGKTFRHQVFSGYKANRTQPPPKYLLALKEWAITEFGLYVCSGYEADDAVAYWMNTTIVCTTDGQFLPKKVEVEGVMKYVQKVMCAVDKDLLKSIPGNHLNYTYKLEDKTKPESLIKGWWVETSVEDASFFIWEQMVMNDNSDGIKGIYGKGKAWCDKNFADKSLKEVQHLVFDEYMKEYGTEQGIHNFQKNFKLLHLLSSDEDFIREVGVLPTFPKIRQVPIKPVEEVNLEDLKF